MAEYLIKEMAKRQGVMEELKAKEMLRWVGFMNNIRVCIDKIVLNNMVYSWQIPAERELLSTDGSFSFSASIQEVIKLRI